VRKEVAEEERPRAEEHLLPRVAHPLVVISGEVREEVEDARARGPRPRIATRTVRLPSEWRLPARPSRRAGRSPPIRGPPRRRR